ncbi:MAG: hypothetical protein ABMA25_01590 [Ilumatobacteraceae bacterium]
MGLFGFQYEFHERSWAELLDFHAPIWAKAPKGQYLVDIIESVIASGRSEELPVTSSMLDLVVVGRPVPDPPMDVLFVRAPGSLHRPKLGCVLIEYEAVSGRDTRIERPVADAVPLFWRFVAEKFGVESRAPANDT